MTTTAHTTGPVETEYARAVSAADRCSTWAQLCADKPSQGNPRSETPMQSETAPDDYMSSTKKSYEI